MRLQIERVFRFVLGLPFLPKKIRAWMFSTGTRAIEVLNAGMLLAWATVMLAGRPRRTGRTPVQPEVNHHG